jgi:peptidylprolyl isomerase|tara:strand:- start:918 stop:1355 length:438 start_codon:yes stop_codon:yes gene_type:complete
MGKKTIAKEGRAVQVHYKGTFKDGSTFDSSYERGEPISFTVGAGEMIPGFDSAVSGMKMGETKSISLSADQAYGTHNPEGIQVVNKEHFPEGFQFESGVVIEGQVGSQPVRGVINTIDDQTVTVDFNHPMAGKDLNFEIELVKVV